VKLSIDKLSSIVYTNYKMRKHILTYESNK